MTWPANSSGWQKLCEGMKSLRRKVWTWTKILSPNIDYFVAIERFVAIYALFGRLWAKKSVLKYIFFSKKCAISWYILHIILNQICKFAITRKNDRFVAKLAIMRLAKVLWPILPSPKGCQLLPTWHSCWICVKYFREGGPTLISALHLSGQNIDTFCHHRYSS